MNADRGIGPLTQMMMSAHNRIVQTERAHREQLEQLAIELVMKEMGIPEGSFQWDVKIVGVGEINTDNFNREQQGEPQIPQVNIEVEEDLMTDLEQLNLEKAKRRLMNAMIQGASKKGHYMYHLVPEKIEEITGSQTLLNDYVGVDITGIKSDNRPVSIQRIAVQNTTNQPQLTEKVVTYLKQKGFTNVYPVPDWPDSQRQTQIIVQKGNRQPGIDLRQVLGLGQIEVSGNGDLESDLTIRIGKDWK
jgi:hypothetical protein